MAAYMYDKFNLFFVLIVILDLIDVDCEELLAKMFRSH